MSRWFSGSLLTLVACAPPALPDDAVQDTSVRDPTQTDTQASDTGAPSELTSVVAVSAGGVDTVDCGEADRPCLTLAAALSRAAALESSEIRMAGGTYEGGQRIVIDVQLSGGWDPGFASNDDPVNVTALVAPPDQSVGLTLAANTSLSNLQVSLSPGHLPQPGASVYGVFVDGPHTVELSAVAVTTPAAGPAGAAGMDGAAAAPATGTCSPDTGASGTAGSAGALQAGTFGPGGFIAGDGGAGADGGDGHDGQRTLAMPGSAMTFSCTFPCGGGIPVVLPAGGDGLAGCGGGGGTAGGGGAGGGSSIGVYGWEADLTLQGGIIAAGNGGDGAAGGQGGEGSSGSAGVDGAPGPLVTVEPSCCGTPTSVSAPGGVGFPGGKGAEGGSGAPGAAGSSYAVYVGDSAGLAVAGTVLQHGTAGAPGQTAEVVGDAGEAAPSNR